MTVTPDARAAFEQWAVRQPGRPASVQSLVEEVEHSADYVGLLTTNIEGRRVVWKQLAFSGDARVTYPPVARESVDPWTADALTLRANSDHIAICNACAGEGKGSCSACTGLGRITCTTCNGERKQYGYASNGSRRLLNCKTCRAKGELDCGRCTRGIALCTTCNGERRMQRWLEIERWQRAISQEHPSHLAQQYGFNAGSTNAQLLRDGDLALDVEQPRRLTPQDLGPVPSNWLDYLAASLQPGERILRQRLRIARVPRFTVKYRVGRQQSAVTFTGNRMMLATPQTSAFEHRASTLRSTAIVLATFFCAMLLISLGRGLFYWSMPTFLSVLAFGGALGSVYGAAADWTAARKHLPRWLGGAALAFILFAVLAFAALPRPAHALRLIAAGELDEAQQELEALGRRETSRDWAPLHLARIRNEQQVSVARKHLAKIPNDAPERPLAEAHIDALVLEQANAHVRGSRWREGAAALELLSQRARGSTEATQIATAVYVPLIREQIVAEQWSAAATTILAAREGRVAPADLDPLAESIRDAALKKIAKARRESDTPWRLRLRLDAEAMLVAWERATERWGTSALMALRTSMARDVATLERRRR